MDVLLNIFHVVWSHNSSCVPFGKVNFLSILLGFKRVTQAAETLVTTSEIRVELLRQVVPSVFVWLRRMDQQERREEDQQDAKLFHDY